MGGDIMYISCKRCGEKFLCKPDESREFCQECRDYEAEHYIKCDECEELYEIEKIIDGLCSTCRSINNLYESEEDNKNKDYEIVSFEELLKDSLEESYD